MKKISFLLIVLFVFFNIAKAQTSFSCTNRHLYIWNENVEKYEMVQEYEEMSLFVINKSETMFTHTTDEIKSTYYIEKKEHDKEKGTYSYLVVSDAGNKYMFVFDFNNKQVRAIGKLKGKDLLLNFDAKNIF